MSELSNLTSPALARWVGIDEAGYGPNLGPLVMTAVVAEGSAERAPDLWNDLSSQVARAGSRDERLWVDDSKKVYSAGRGRDRLEAATFAAIEACGHSFDTLNGLLAAVDAGHVAREALAMWSEDEIPPRLPSVASESMVTSARQAPPFAGAPWRLVAVRSVVVDAEAFHRSLALHSSKAGVHFEAFTHLLRPLLSNGGQTFVRSDKHGGRHYYYAPLVSAFPDHWVDRVEEGASRSAYILRQGHHRLTLELTPRADADDGLVAIASIVSKTIRELWMDTFNAFWHRRIPGLRPTAGYPQDAQRFRKEIASTAEAMKLDPSRWWRLK